MKKSTATLAILLVALIALPLVGCNETTVSTAPNYQEAMQCVPYTNVKTPINSVRVGDILFQQYKLGTVNQCFVQNVTKPVEQDGNLESLSYTESTITSKTISEGLSKTISTTDTIEIVDSTTKTLAWEVSTDVEAKATAKVGAHFAIFSAGADASATYHAATSVGGSTSEIHSETIAKSTTETINSSYDVTSFVEKVKTLSLQYNMKNYEVGHIYALALIADVDVYQVIAIDMVKKEFYNTYFLAEYDEDQAYIKMLSSDNWNYDISPEKQLAPITEVSIPSGEHVNFSGGTGTEQDPYLIDSAEKFNNIRFSPNSCYKLTSDIDLTGLAVEGVSQFGGILDGDGHTISGVVIDTDRREAGLFDKCSGIVKNLTVSNSFVKTSVQDNDAFCGMIVGELFDKGKMLSCYVIDCEIEVYARDRDDAEGTCRYAVAGGVVGKSSGEVANCEVIRTSLYGYCKKHDNAWSTGWNEAAYVYLGGVVGEFYSGFVHDNTTTSLQRLEGMAEYRGNSAWFVTIDTYLRICLGGVIGRQNGASLTQNNNQCKVSPENFISNSKSYNETGKVVEHKQEYKNEVVGYVG